MNFIYFQESEALLTDSSQAPTLILSRGKAYGVLDIEVQQKIHQLVAQPTETVQKGGDSTNQVYWLRGGGNIPSPTEMETPSSPTLPEPLSSGSNSSCCSISESSRRVHTPQQNETTALHMSQLSPPVKSTAPSDLSVHPMNPNAVLSPILTRPVRKPFMRIPNTEEDGDYATLRDLPLVTLPEETEPVDIHEISSSSDSSGVDSGFGSGGTQRQNILPIQSRSSPVIGRQAPNRDLCNPYGYVKPKMTTFASLPGKGNNIAPMQLQNAAQQRSPFNSLPLAHMQR